MADVQECRDPELSYEASFSQGAGPRLAETYSRKGPDSWPWQASIFLDTRYRCEGALISREWVLTGANCFGRCVQGRGGVGAGLQEGGP